jgi:hypothetical protein
MVTMKLLCFHVVRTVLLLLLLLLLLPLPLPQLFFVV